MHTPRARKRLQDAPIGLLARALLCSLSACLPPREPPALDAEARLAELHVRAARFADDGGELSARCVPSGLEQCFNARDDDCNGMVDEGCGVPESSLQLHVAWQGDANVNLELLAPSGSVVTTSRNQTGFRYVIDCPSAPRCYGQNRDVLVWSGEGEPAPGRYLLRVILREHGSLSAWPLRVQLAIRSDAGVRQGELSLDPRAPARELWFEL